MPKNERVSKKILSKKSMIGSIDMLLVAIVHPITGGNAPAAPPITIFCAVFFLTKLYKQNSRIKLL